MNQNNFKKTLKNSQDNILRPDIHRQISELLDQDYNISPDQVLVNVDRINFNKIDKMNPPVYQGQNKYIPLNINMPRVTQYSDSQIQTDLSFKDIKVRGDVNPVFSEVEILGFTFMTEKERREQLKALMYDEYPIEKYDYDPCTDYASFTRDNESYRERSTSTSRRKQVPIVQTRSIASQTLFTTKPDKHQSTQTIYDYTTPESSENSPLHQLLVAKTKTVIKTDPENEGFNKIRERFTIKNKKDEPYGYTQTSEYRTNPIGAELIKSSLDFQKPVDTKIKETDMDKKKLVKSTMEMTSVINNKTTVTGISVKDAPERFTIQIINPDGGDVGLSESSFLSQEQAAESNSSSPRFDKKFSNDIYNPNDFRSKSKPVGVKCEDDVVVREEDLGFNSEKSDNSSVRNFESKFLIPGPKPIQQSTPDLSKITKTTNEFSIPKYETIMKPPSNSTSNFKKMLSEKNLNESPKTPSNSVNDFKRILSEKNIPNNPELNDSMIKTSLKSIYSVKSENIQNENRPKTPTSSTTNFKKLLTEKNLPNNPELNDLIMSSSAYNFENRPKTPSSSVSNFKKNLISNPDLKSSTNFENRPKTQSNSASNFKKQLTETNQKMNTEFSIHQIPRMFRYDAPNTIEDKSNLNISSALKKTLNQNEMIIVDNHQNIKNQKSIIKPRTTSTGSYGPKQIKRVDFTENDSDTDIIDFDAYDKPIIKQFVQEIEVPADQVDENVIVERASFRTDSSSSSKPEVKERKQISRQQFVLPDTKIHNQPPSYDNLKQRLLTKNQINVNDDDVMPKPVLNFIHQNLPSKSTNVILNNSENIMNIAETKIRMFSQSPTLGKFNTNKELTRSIENIDCTDEYEFETIGFNAPRIHKTKSVETLDQIDKPMSKMEKLILTNLEREVKKAIKREEQRKKRIPEIIKLFETSHEKDLLSLEEELRLLMRKSKIDEELIKSYNEKKQQCLSNDTQLGSTSLTSFNKNKVKVLSKATMKKDFNSSNKTLESGYSSLEDSLSELRLKEEKKNLPEIRPMNENIVAMLNQIETNRTNLNSVSYKPRTVPTSQGGSGSGSNRSVGSNQNTASNNSVFLSNPNSATSSTRIPNDDDDTDDEDERRKKKNVLDNRRNVNKKEPGRKKVTYVVEDDLKNIDLSDFSFETDPDTDETILINLKTNESFVILRNDWRDAENSYYIAEDDIDTSRMPVKFDEKTNRRFVMDEANNKRYYLVEMESIRSFGQPLERIEDSDQVVRLRNSEDSDVESEIEIDYVDQNELANTNLDEFATYQDENSGEVILVSRKDTRKRWVVLPNNWKTENSPYIGEEDINLINMDVYQDVNSKRKYVIDDITGQRFYLVPKFRNDIRNSINVPDLSKTKSEIKSEEFTSPKVEDKKTPQEGPGSNIKPKPRQNVANNQKLMIGDENIENLENEPSNARLRESEAKSPIRHIRFDPNLPSRNLTPSNKIIIKQPGKPGHLIRTDGKKEDKSDISKSKKPPKKMSEKQIKQELAKKQLQAKMKLDASRQAFFQQKLPDVGKLWMHQLLIAKTNEEKMMDNLMKCYNSSDNLSDDSDRDTNRKPWRSLNNLNDPTLTRDENGQEALDRKRLAEIQIYGYDKFDKSKKKRNIFDEDENKHRNGSSYQPAYDPNNPSFGGFENYPFIRGVLTEDFVESKEYRPVQMNRHYRALVPHNKLNLRQQFLTSPRYLKPTWDDVLKQSSGMQPKIILINDDELILTKNRDCNVYVQYVYENDGVLGANKAYQLMLPERGPTNPARPLMISPAKLSKQIERKLPSKPEYALRDAPVFVYHQNGNAFYENLAQYLAGQQPKLSPKTARKMLQFTDSKEFEEYLASKLTREEAQRLAKMSGEEIISVDSVKKEILKATRDRKETNGEPLYYHMNCEYDNLRPFESGKFDEETKEYEIAGSVFKSTFIGFDKNGDAKKVKFNDLPKNLVDVVSEASSSISSKSLDI